MNDSPQSHRWCAAGYSIINSGSNLESIAMPSSSPYVRFERNQQQGVIKNRGHRRPAPQPKSVAGLPLFTIAAAPFSGRVDRGTQLIPRVDCENRNGATVRRQF